MQLLNPLMHFDANYGCVLRAVSPRGSPLTTSAIGRGVRGQKLVKIADG